MVRLALGSLFLALVLTAIGHLSNAWAVFEVLRVAGGALLMLGIGAMIAVYLRTPDPPEK